MWCSAPPSRYLRPTHLQSWVHAGLSSACGIMTCRNALAARSLVRCAVVKQPSMRAGSGFSGVRALVFDDGGMLRARLAMPGVSPSMASGARDSPMCWAIHKAMRKDHKRG